MNNYKSFNHAIDTILEFEKPTCFSDIEKDDREELSAMALMSDTSLSEMIMSAVEEICIDDREVLAGVLEGHAASEEVLIDNIRRAAQRVVGVHIEKMISDRKYSEANDD